MFTSNAVLAVDIIISVLWVIYIYFFFGIISFIVYRSCRILGVLSSILLSSALSLFSWA